MKPVYVFGLLTLLGVLLLSLLGGVRPISAAPAALPAERLIVNAPAAGVDGPCPPCPTATPVCQPGTICNTPPATPSCDPVRPCDTPTPTATPPCDPALPCDTPTPTATPPCDPAGSCASPTPTATP